MPFALSKTLDERIGNVDDRIRVLEVGFGRHESMCKQRKEDTERRFDNLEKGQSTLGDRFDRKLEQKHTELSYKLDAMRKERVRDRTWAIGLFVTISIAVIGWIVRLMG